MKKKALIITALIVLAIAAAAIVPNIVFTSSGYHRLFGYNSFNLEGTCFVFDAAGTSVGTAPIRVKTVQPSSGEMRKDCVFDIKGYIESTATNEANSDETAAKGILWIGESCYGVLGEGTLVYRTAEVNNSDEEDPIKYLEPKAELFYEETENAFVIRLRYGESDELRYTAVFGPKTEAEAAAVLEGFGR